jgi:hypothetical protein
MPLRPWRAAAAAAALIASTPLTAYSTTRPSAVPSRLTHARGSASPSSPRLWRPQYTQYCTGTGLDAFVGGAGGGAAAGPSSGILSGTANQTCGLNDAIGAGYGNAIYPNVGPDHESFIGAGDDNSIYSNGFGGTYGAFIGAGSSNTVTAWYAGIVAGTNNTIGTAGATGFIGAGDGNTVNAEYAFVGAGQNNQALGTAGFVGAGSQNKALGQNAAVVSGSKNLALGPSSFVGAGQSNQAGLVFFGATTDNAFVGAGASNLAYGNDAFVGSGSGNQAVSDYSFIGAGLNNKTGLTAFVGGGSQNNASGQNSFIGGGYNGISSGAGAFVGGGGMAFFQAGSKGSNTAAGTDAFVGAGDGNLAGTVQSVVIGGVGNRIISSTAGGSTGAIDAAIGGGYENLIEATASGGAAYGVIAGGRANVIAGVAGAVGGGAENAATGSYSTVPGGFENSATGSASFAAGTKAGAKHNGAFVWSDDAGTAALNSTAPYQFSARASGGFYLFSNAAATAGVKLAPGSGAWASLSDRNMKTAIVPLDDAAILAKVAALPVSSWSYTTERGVRHAGPMAQDFYAAFGVGEDDRHITSIDEDGVALAAIKGLYERSKRENVRTRREQEVLDIQQASIQRRLAVLAAKVDFTEKMAALVQHGHRIRTRPVRRSDML